MRRLCLLLLAVSALATAPTAATAARPTAADVVAAAAKLGVGDQAGRLRSRFLPGARLVAAPTAHARLGATRLGGAPDLPAATPWPSCNGHPLTSVAQIALGDVRAAVPGATRGTGLLSIFMGTRYAPDGAPEAAGVFNTHGGLARVGHVKCFAVLHTAPAARLVHRRSPSGSNPFRAVAQRLRPTLTIPNAETADDRFGTALGQDDAAFDGWAKLERQAEAGTLGRAPGDFPLRQVLGWSDPLQEDPTDYRCAGQPSLLLLQFDSDDTYDLDQTEAGFLMLVIGVGDLRAGRLDRLCVEHQLD